MDPDAEDMLSERTEKQTEGKPETYFLVHLELDKKEIFEIRHCISLVI